MIHNDDNTDGDERGSLRSATHGQHDIGPSSVLEGGHSVAAAFAHIVGDEILLRLVQGLKDAKEAWWIL